MILADKTNNLAFLYRYMLQTSWARGYDLQQGVSQSWLRAPTSPAWNGQEFWSRLQTLPKRSEWRYADDPNPPLVLHLDDRHVVIPGGNHRYRQAWLGAEAGIRETLPHMSRNQDSLLLHYADWPTALAIMQRDDLQWDTPFSVMPKYRQATLMEVLFGGRPTDCWTVDIFSQSTGALRRAVLGGLLQPASLRRANAAAWRDGAGYRGEAKAASAWLSMVGALIVVTERPDFFMTFRTTLGRLSPYSQTRVIGEWTLSEFHRGTPWTLWSAQLAESCHYYPADHVVPNVAGIIAAILWGHSTWTDVLFLSSRNGYDPLTRCLVTGSLLGLADKALPTLPETLRYQLYNYGDETFSASPRLRSPP